MKLLKWFRKRLDIKSGKRVVYTLDKEGGLVVSRALLIERQGLSKQAKALRDRRENGKDPVVVN